MRDACVVRYAMRVCVISANEMGAPGMKAITPYNYLCVRIALCVEFDVHRVCVEMAKYMSVLWVGVSAWIPACLCL